MRGFIGFCLLIFIWAISAGAFMVRPPAAERALSAPDLEAVTAREPAENTARAARDRAQKAIAARDREDKERARAEHAQSSASELCLNSVRAHAQYPSKADFYRFSHAITKRYAYNGGGWQVTGEVDLMNGFGAMLPHNYWCVSDGTGLRLVDLVVTPE